MNSDLGRLVLRLMLGGLVLFHGIHKLVYGIAGIVERVGATGLPSGLAYLVYLGEVAAPVLVIIGLYTRAAAGIIVINMVVAVLLVHLGQVFTLTPPGGWALELQASYLFTALALTGLGAGRYSVGGRNGRWN